MEIGGRENGGVVGLSGLRLCFAHCSETSICMAWCLLLFGVSCSETERKSRGPINQFLCAYEGTDKQAWDGKGKGKGTGNEYDYYAGMRTAKGLSTVF